MSTARYTMDEGEDFPIRFDVVASTAPWNDLSSATVTLGMKVSATSTLYTSTDATLDTPGQDGMIHGGYVMASPTAPAGIYRTEVQIEIPARARPIVEQLTINVIPRLAKPVA